MSVDWWIFYFCDNFKNVRILHSWYPYPFCFLSTTWLGVFEVSFPTWIIYNGTVYTLWSRIRDQEQGKQTRSIITSGQAHAPSIRTRNYLSTDLHFLFPECLHTARCSLLLPELSYNKANVSIIYDTFYPDYLPRLD